MKLGGGSCLSTMHIGSGKTSQYIDTIYKKTAAHTQIEETTTSKKVDILKDTR